MATKQEQANAIYRRLAEQPRAEIIAEIQHRTGAGEAYAGTLYRNARKNACGIRPKTAKASRGPVAPMPPPRRPAAPAASAITRFDRPACRQARAAVEDALGVLEQQLGVKVELGSGSYMDEEYSVKVRLVITGGEDVAKRDWDNNCILFGLKPEQFGTTFEHQGTTFTVCGIKPKSRNAVIGVNANGTRYKFNPNVLPGGFPIKQRRGRTRGPWD